MKQFKIELFKGHPIITDGKNRILIDTGAPTTIHSTDNLKFCLENFDCSVNYLGLTVSEISRMLGTEISTLLGADILSRYNILFDYQNELIVFSKQKIEFEGIQNDISNFMGIPIVTMKVDKRYLKFFLDTGAKLSYLSENFTRNYVTTGQEKDFYPGIGEFQTECFEIPTIFGDDKFVVKYGNLPPLLQMTLTMSGVDGIVGFDFFNNFQVLLSLENNRISFKAN
jgi:hypothetical protein